MSVCVDFLQGNSSEIPSSGATCSSLLASALACSAPSCPSTSHSCFAEPHLGCSLLSHDFVDDVCRFETCCILTSVMTATRKANVRANCQSTPPPLPADDPPELDREVKRDDDIEEDRTDRAMVELPEHWLIKIRRRCDGRTKATAQLS